jgi:hypothetical protein
LHLLQRANRLPKNPLLARESFDGSHVWGKPGLSGYLVCLVHLVSLIQPNKPDRPNRPNEQDRLVDFSSILLGTDKLIRLFLQPDFGLRSMPRHHDRVILQGVQPLSNGLLDGFEVSAPEIGAPDAAAKECVAG